jgi:glycosyltransferase involved in cell wall biosynthesis
MKVPCVVLLPTRVFGGHEKMLVQWLTRAVAHGLKVQIYSAHNERLIRECESAGLGRPAVSHPSQAAPLRDFLITWRLLGRIRKEVPVLLAPGVLQASPLQWVAAFLRGRQVAGYVPMAYSSRDMRFRGGQVRDWIVGQVVRRVDLWITISERQRQLLTERWHVKRPVFVVPNRLALLEEGNPPPPQPCKGPLRVLFAGRFDAHQKGLDWLSERLRERAGEWRGRLQFTFMGDGQFGLQLLRLASELGEAHVAVRPWGDVGRAMAQHDVLVLPSRFEGVPLVALEATHYGLPVVASKEAGVSALVPPWCLFSFGDEAAMWTALNALQDRDKRAVALACSRSRLQNVLSPSSFIREVERIVGALAGMSQRGASTATR